MLRTKLLLSAMHRPIVVGVTGASGLIYAVRTVKFLLASNFEVDLVASRASHLVWRDEMQTQMPFEPVEQESFWREQTDETAGKLRCHAFGNVGASIASGSYRTLGMVIIPCSMSTVGKLAAGLSSDLLERAADVQLKESRPLILVPRETPFSLIHLRNLTSLAEAGARIVPAIPAWYQQPKTIEDLVDFVVGRALDQLNIDHDLFVRWNS
jgi:flavin prenyltransferase